MSLNHLSHNVPPDGRVRMFQGRAKAAGRKRFLNFFREFLRLSKLLPVRLLPWAVSIHNSEHDASP